MIHRRRHSSGALPSARRPAAALAALLVLWLWPAFAAPAGAAAALAPSPESVRARLDALDGREDLSNQNKARLRQTYTQTIAYLEEAVQWRQGADAHRADAAEAPALLDRTRAELARPAPAVPVPAGASLSELERGLQDAQARLDIARAEVTRLSDEPRRRAERRIEAASRLPEARSQLAEAQAQLSAAPEDESELGRARSGLLQAKAAALQAEAEALDAELNAYDAEEGLLAAQEAGARLAGARAQKEVAAWSGAASERRLLEAEDVVARARKLAAEVPAPLKEMADENAGLAERAAGADGLYAKLRAAEQRLQQSGAKLANLEADFARLRAWAGTGPMTASVGALLLRKRAELPDPQRYRQGIRARQSGITDAQFELLALEDARLSPADLEARTRETIRRLTPLPPGLTVEQVTQSAREVLENRAEVQEHLISGYRSYFSALTELDRTEQALVAALVRYAAYAERKLLWFQGQQPLGWRDPPGAWADLGRLLNADAWLASTQGLLRDAAANPHLHLLALVLLAALVRFRGTLRSRLRRAGELSREVATDSFRLTLTAAGLTFLAAAPGPFLLWYVGWRVGSPAEAPELAAALSAALRNTAVVYLTLAVVRLSCMPEGLADAHFRWPDVALRTLRRGMNWFIPVALPLLFAYLLCQGPPEMHALGRLAFVALLTALSALLWRLLSPRAGVFADAVSRRPGGWLAQLRFFWHTLLSAVPLALAVAAAGGYVYAARQLASRLLWTLWLGVAVLLAHELMLRWLFVTRRRLAVQRARRRREVQRADEAAERETPPEAEGPAAPADGLEVPLHAMSAQARQLLASVLVAGLAIGIWLVWADVLPALDALGEMSLWGGLTVGGAVRAVVLVVLTVIAARNIPGLLEFAVLQRLPLEGGLRFAVSAIARYAITLVGLILAAQALGVGWDKVQWLAAAATFGLGFGLQEIFANFVSGLIMLLERPMRVGDTVTVGETTGIVTRIRMRATTITDWDRKELIVPNREFITGRLVNWTLSDRVLRVVVPVGIAYGSDTRLARELLLKVAYEHPDVLKDPDPVALFLGFGDSALNFELRAFIPSVELRLKVAHDLHMAVDDAFRQAGIEIAFPQRDIHVRSTEAALPLADEPQHEQGRP